MKNNFENFKAENEVIEFENIKPTQYLCKIVDVEDVEDREYLKIAFDIVKDKNGNEDLKGYFNKYYEEYGKWNSQGIIYRSYKLSAQRFFEQFITAIEKSNNGYTWNFDEKTLVGKYFIANFGEEEYYDSEGELKTSVKVQEIRSVSALKEGKIKDLAIKKVKKTTTAPQKLTVNEDDLPF